MGQSKAARRGVEQPEAHRHTPSLWLPSQEGWTPGRGNLNCCSSSVNTLVENMHIYFTFKWGWVRMIWLQPWLESNDFLKSLFKLIITAPKPKIKLYKTTFYFETESIVIYGGKAKFSVAYNEAICYRKHSGAEFSLPLKTNNNNHHHTHLFSNNILPGLSKVVMFGLQTVWENSDPVFLAPGGW